MYKAATNHINPLYKLNYEKYLTVNHQLATINSYLYIIWLIWQYASNYITVRSIVNA